MRTNRRSASALLATTAFAAVAVAFAGNASAASSAALDGGCSVRNGTVVTLDLTGYSAGGRNIAHVSLDGSKPSTVSFGSSYHWSSGRLDPTVSHLAQVSVSSRTRGSSTTFTDTVSVSACQA